MRYMLLIYDEETKLAKMSKPERGAIHQEYGEFIDDIRKKGAFLAGDPLQPTSTATTVRGKNGKTITTDGRSEEHTSELQSQSNLVCRLLLEKKKKKTDIGIGMTVTTLK